MKLKNGWRMKHNKKSVLIAGTAVTVIIIAILFCGCMETEKEIEDTKNIKEIKNNSITIKVVKFEPNNPCQGCTNLGNFANETIQKYFLEDYKSGKITYETVNFQDPKNTDMIKKYNVLGSSLYINVIKDGKEEIIVANKMWDYVWNKEEYIKIFKNKLETLKNA